MKLLRLSFLATCAFFSTITIVAQNTSTTWQHYFGKSSINDIAGEGNYLWLATTGNGLVRFEKTTGDMVFYTKINSGIPSQTVTSVVVDGNGVKWVGTTAGVARFDGTDWTVSDMDEDLPNNSVNTIYMDNGNNLWAGTGGFGAAKLANNGYFWQSYLRLDGSILHYADNYIYKIQGDTDGNIWMGTANGLVQINGSTQTVHTLPDPSVSAIFVDNNVKWFGTYNGWSTLEGSTWTNYSSTGLPDKYIKDITKDRNGNIWFATSSGVAKYEAQAFTTYTNTKAKVLFPDADGSLWIGTETGLEKLVNGVVTTYTVGSFPENDLNFVTIHPDGRKFIGTERGLITYNEGVFGLYTTAGESNSIRGRGKIDAAKNAWIGAYYGLVTIDQANTKSFYTKLNSNIPADNVSALEIDTKGNKWVGTLGLSKFDGTSWVTYNTTNSALPSNFIQSIVDDKAGNLWIATVNGLVVYDGTNWTTYNTSNSSLPDNRVNHVYVDSKGVKWICTFGGLTKIDGANWTTYTNLNSNLVSNNISHIIQDNLGNYWISTYVGLFKFDGTTWTTIRAENSPLITNQIRHVAIDKNNNKWISTNGGLFIHNEAGIADITVGSDAGEEPSEGEPGGEENPVTAIEAFEHNSVSLKSFPSPATNKVNIEFTIPRSETIEIDLIDLQGKIVTNLYKAYETAGQHAIAVDTHEQPAGLFLIRLKGSRIVANSKIVLCK